MCSQSSHYRTRSRSSVTILLMPLLLIFSLSACSSNAKKEREAPKAQTIRVDTTELTGGEPGTTIEKELVTIIVTPKKILVDSKPVRNVKKLEQYLSKRNKPVITIRAHKCADTQLTTQVMSLSRDYTDTSIPFGSYGSYDDAECTDK